MITLIVANGEIKDYSFFIEIVGAADFVVAVDGGLKHVEKLDISPDIMIGDFDSIDDIEYYRNLYPNAEVFKYFKRKDYTDLELAIEETINREPEKVVIIGVTGSRLDHTMGAIFLLDKFLDSKIEVSIVDEKNEIFMVNGFKKVFGNIGDLFSIIPISETVENIYLDGFEYPLDNATLKFGSSTGISNVFSRCEGSVRISKGKLLAIKSMD